MVQRVLLCRRRRIDPPPRGCQDHVAATHRTREVARVSKFSRRAFLAGAASYVALGASLERAQAQRRAVSAKFDLDRLIDEVKRARKEPDSQAAVQAVLQRAVSDPRAVLDGLGEPKEVGLNTLYRADDLTILNVVWAPFMVLLPHNHNMWASIGIYTGREDNIV